MAVAIFAFKTTGDYSNLTIGQVAPNQKVEMKDVSGKQVSLNAAKGENGLVVIFSCNTCPFVVGNGEKSQGWENRYNNITASAKKMGMGTILINSNEAKRDKGDSFEEMTARATEMEYTSFYALDEGHKMADIFGAKTTPHVFAFDADMKLIYQGAIDDNVDSKSKVKNNYLENALKSHNKGEAIKIKETKPVGCSIKRITPLK
jgi:hypothetical protein